MVYRKHTYMRLDGSSKISERRDMVADFQSRWVQLIVNNTVSLWIMPFFWFLTYIVNKLDATIPYMDIFTVQLCFNFSLFAPTPPPPDSAFSRTDIFVFLLSTRAGGLGINLTAADTVSHWTEKHFTDAVSKLQQH